MARVYGNTNTHLTLSDKAQKYYDLTDPIEITEYETEDGYIYDIDDSWYLRLNYTESELNEYLEECFEDMVLAELKDVDPLIEIERSDLRRMTLDEIMAELDRVYAEAQA